VEDKDGAGAESGTNRYLSTRRRRRATAAATETDTVIWRVNDELQYTAVISH